MMLSGHELDKVSEHNPQERFRGPFMVGMFRGVLFISIACLLFACADYRIARPTTEAGRLCAAACDKARAMCDRDAEAEASLAASGCDSENKSSPVQPCTPQDGKDTAHCLTAPHPPICVSPAPMYGPCTSEWEQCVLSCGGRMTDSRTKQANP